MTATPLLATRSRRPDWTRDLLVIARPSYLLMLLTPILALGLLVSGGFWFGFETPGVLWTGWLGGIAGFFGGAMLRELQHTTIAWTIPRMRSRIATAYAVGWMAVASVLLAVPMIGFCAWLRSSQVDMIFAPWHVHFASALTGVSIGTVLLDALAPVRTYAAFASVVAITIASPLWGRFVAEIPVVVWAIALCASVYAYRRVFSAKWWRAMPAVPTAAVAAAHYAPRSVERYQRERRARRRASSRRFARTPLRERRSGWVDAAMIEGVSRRRWAMQGWALICVLLLAMCMTWDALGIFSAAELPSAATTVYALAFGDEGVVDSIGPVTPTWLLVFWAILMAARLRCDLRRGVPFPLSRTERARAVWGAQLRVLVWSALVPAAVFVVVGLSAAAVAGVPVRTDVLPEIARCGLLSAVLVVPVFQSTVRSGVLYSRRTGSSPRYFILLASIVFVQLTLVVLRETHAPLLVELSPLVAAGAFAWFVHRQWLVRYFARIDLVDE